MKIIILPGFSPKNKEWADETAKALDAQVQEWKHWQTGNNEDFVLEDEVKKILEMTNGKEVSILAKSIGTWVCMHAMRQGLNVQKLFLCGIPLTDLTDEEKEIYKEILATFSSEQLLCFQNADDNHGNFEEAKKFLASINNKIRIESKPRSDHDYPYFDDFKKFFR